MAAGFSLRDEIEEFITHVQEVFQPRASENPSTAIRVETPKANTSHRSGGTSTPSSPHAANPQSGNSLPHSRQDSQASFPSTRAQRPSNLSTYTALSRTTRRGNTPYRQASTTLYGQTAGTRGRAGSAWTAARDAVTRNTKPRSNVPAHQNGSFINMNASNATKRILMEKEMEELQREGGLATTARQRDDLTRRRSNVAHQLSMLDAAEGKAPRTYANAGPSPEIERAMDKANGIPEINALGAGDYGSTARQEQREQREQAMLDRFYKNQALERANYANRARGVPNWFDDTGHINGQALGDLATMSIGPSIDESSYSPFVKDELQKFREKNNYYPFGSFGHSACEVIAVYNALHDMGKDVSLAKIAYDAEKNGYMLANGWMGTKTWKVDDMLRQYGVESATAKPENVQKSADSGKLKEGQVYVASIWNNTNDKTGLADIGSGIHTFEVVYSPGANADKPWVVYNRDSSVKTELRYKSINDILSDDKRGTYGAYMSILEMTDAGG